MAVRLGFVEAVDLLVTSTSNALQIQNNCILHWAVKHNQVKLVQILIKQKVGLSKLINQPASDDEGDELSQSNGDTNTQQAQPIVLRGDTPLHIAARNKYEHMVDLLLRVDGMNKNACNSEGKTPLDIAREFTEYHESMGIIKKLIDYPDKCKTFMYCAPQVSHAKHRNATKMVNEAFRERRAAELVVAALLATMTFTAAFTLPGGVNTEAPQSEQGHSEVAEAPQSDQGSPILISLISFKLFLIFDCVAFFLSLLACIMWEMSSELTTGDKMLSMTLNGLVVCRSFGFTAYGFMAAVYAMLARKVKTFAWVILGSLIFITWGGFVAFMYQLAMFAVGRARFHRLYGVPRLFDDIVEKLWNRAERHWLLFIFRWAAELFFALVAGDSGLLNIFFSGHRSIFRCTRGGSGGQNDNGHSGLFNIFRCTGGGSGGRNGNGHGGRGSGGQNEDEDEHSNNCSCSSSPWLPSRSTV